MHALERPFSLLLAGLLALLLSRPAHGQGSTYDGEGFVQDLVELPAGATRIEDVAVAELDGDARPDVAMLVSDGQIAINVEAEDKGRYFYVAGSFVAMDVVSEAGVDELMATDGTALYRIVWSGTSFAAQVVDGAAQLGGRFLRAVATETGVPGLAVIDSSGATARILTRTGGAWSVTETITASPSQAQLHAVERMDFDADASGDLETVVISDAGFDVLGMPSPPATLPFPPAGAMVEVVPGASTGGGRDLAVLYFVLGGDAFVHVLNSAHVEWIPLGAGRVGSMALVDVLFNDGRGDLVLSMDSEPTLYYLEHVAVAAVEDPIFAFPATATGAVDLQVIGLDGPCLLPISGPPYAGGDIDSDGDVDGVFVSNCNYLCILPGEACPEVRPQVDETPWPQLMWDGGQRYFSYTVWVDPPPGTTVLHCSVYHQPGLYAQVTADPIGTTSVPTGGGGLLLNLFFPAPPPTPNEVFQVLIRPEDGSTSVEMPSSVRFWGPGFSVYQGLEADTEKIYPWMDHEDGPGGTVGRPRVDPIGGP